MRDSASVTKTNAEPRIEDGSFRSDAVNGTLHYAIALPPGYDGSDKRYPVVYFLHGLPANAQAYKGHFESWSGYFVLTTRQGKPCDLGSPEANAQASVPQLEANFGPYAKTFFGFSIGAQDEYPGFVEDNQRLSRELTSAGIPHVFKLYEGGHNSPFWSKHQDEWLAGAVERLDTPT